MSVFILALASFEKTLAAIPGLSGTPERVILPSFFVDVIPIILTCSIDSSPFSLTIVPVESSNDDLK